MKYAHSSCYDGGMENNYAMLKLYMSGQVVISMKESVDLEKGMEKVK